MDDVALAESLSSRNRETNRRNSESGCSEVVIPVSRVSVVSSGRAFGDSKNHSLMLLLLCSAPPRVDDNIYKRMPRFIHVAEIIKANETTFPSGPN